MHFRLSLSLILAALIPSAGFARAPCLTDGQIERALGEAIRSGATVVSTSHLPDRPLCSALTLAQRIQQMRAEAFPAEAARAEAERQEMIRREDADRALIAMEAQSSPALDDVLPPSLLAQPAERVRESRPTTASLPARRQTSARTRSAATAQTRVKKPARHFSSCRAARAAGYSRMRRGEPGYSASLDRDGDGIACE